MFRLPFPLPVAGKTAGTKKGSPCVVTAVQNVTEVVAELCCEFGGNDDLVLDFQSVADEAHGAVDAVRMQVWVEVEVSPHEALSFRAEIIPIQLDLRVQELLVAKTKSRKRSRADLDPAMLVRRYQMEGASIRMICAETGWSYGTVHRRLVETPEIELRRPGGDNRSRRSTG